MSPSALAKQVGFEKAQQAWPPGWTTALQNARYLGFQGSKHIVRMYEHTHEKLFKPERPLTLRGPSFHGLAVKQAKIDPATACLLEAQRMISIYACTLAVALSKSKIRTPGVPGASAKRVDQ